MLSVEARKRAAVSPEACVFTIGLIGVLIFMWLAEAGSEMCPSLHSFLPTCFARKVPTEQTLDLKFPNVRDLFTSLMFSLLESSCQG